MALYRVTISGRCLGQVQQNVLMLDDVNNVRTHTQIKDHVLANWITNIKAAQVSAFTYETIEVRNDGAGGQPVTSFVLGQIPGTHGGAGILNVGAFIIQKRSGLSGRQNRGRLYLGGPRADWTSNNLINAAGVAGMAPILTALKQAYINTPGTTDLFLRVKGKQPGAPVVQLNDLVLATGIGIQRRRNINVGI